MPAAERKVGPSARGNAGKGRIKGVPNKITGQVKEMILQALDEAGGVEYLKRQAEQSPAAFLTLVGKVLPMTIAGDDGAPLRHIIDLSDEALAAIAASGSPATAAAHPANGVTA